MSKQILSPHGSVVSVAKIDTSAISAAVWEVSVGANWYCYTATEQRANHLRQLLSDHPEGAYPAPRDARTDQPKKEDGDNNGSVLSWSEAGKCWFVSHYRNVISHWIPTPQAIPEQKSEAEQAWEIRKKELSLSNAQSFREYELAKQEFSAGYEAAKKGGGA